MDRTYLIDDEEREVGPEPLPPRVTDVRALPNHRLRLAFSTGEVRDYDVTPWLERGIFERLRDPALFEQVYLDGGTAAWPGGLDIGPRTLYEGSVYVREATAVEL